MLFDAEVASAVLEKRSSTVATTEPAATLMRMLSAAVK